tara:strand:- start:5937 stop:6545 length:609 start_codon:yes stop_codon:yes gene_type:complete
MTRLTAVVVVAVIVAPGITVAQRNSMKTEPAEFQCPSVLGPGATTMNLYCDVLTERDPAKGIIIQLPPHSGVVTLSFNLHNRHTYSQELVDAKRAYRQYTATIGILTADNTLISRAIIQSEFRTVADLVERVEGGAGPGGVKAVAPNGTQAIKVVIPPEEESVSVLGEKLSVVRLEASDNFSAMGRPVAIISDIQITYRPAP